MRGSASAQRSDCPCCPPPPAATVRLTGAPGCMAHCVWATHLWPRLTVVSLL